MQPVSRLIPWMVAGTCAVATIVVLYPGQYPFDSAYQLWQARTGQCNDQSPVAMNALWSLLLHISPNPATLFCLNLAMFWAGLALGVVAISENPVARVVLLLACGMVPLTLVEMAHLLTDAHLAAVLVLATGLGAWGLTQARRIPLLACLFLLLYAGAVRHHMLSGYRVLSRRFVKSFPARSAGFETEMELAVHALKMRMPVVEVTTAYKPRPTGSESRLHTWRDGLKILHTIVTLFKSEKPLTFFSIVACACAALSLILAVPLLKTYLETGLVPRFPTAILSAALMLFGAIFLACGLVLDTVTRGRAEIKRLSYLSIPTPSPHRE